MKKIYISLMVWGACLLGGCSEDALVPSVPSHNFAPDANASDEESVLRREFFEKNGCYVLFNDTLRHDYIGLDDDGDPYYDTELVDPAWSLTGTEGYVEYRFQYFNTIEEKRECVELLNDVLDLLVQHNLTKPYSILAVKEIQKIVDKGSAGISVSYYEQLSTLRCFIINLSEFNMTDKIKYQITSTIGGTGFAVKYAEELADFYRLMIDEYGYPIYDSYNYYCYTIEDFNEVGFLDMAEGMYFQTQAEDVAAYLNLLLTQTPDWIKRKYGKYDIILKKYELIRKIADQYNIKY